MWEPVALELRHLPPTRFSSHSRLVWPGALATAPARCSSGEERFRYFHSSVPTSTSTVLPPRDLRQLRVPCELSPSGKSPSIIKGDACYRHSMLWMLRLCPLAFLWWLSYSGIYKSRGGQAAEYPSFPLNRAPSVTITLPPFTPPEPGLEMFLGWGENQLIR